jgi:hypothetical protein
MHALLGVYLYVLCTPMRVSELKCLQMGVRHQSRVRLACYHWEGQNAIHFGTFPCACQLHPMTDIFCADSLLPEPIHAIVCSHWNVSVLTSCWSAGINLPSAPLPSMSRSKFDAEWTRIVADYRTQGDQLPGALHVQLGIRKRFYRSSQHQSIFEGVCKPFRPFQRCVLTRFQLCRVGQEQESCLSTSGHRFGTVVSSPSWYVCVEYTLSDQELTPWRRYPAQGCLGTWSRMCDH